MKKTKERTGEMSKKIRVCVLKRKKKKGLKKTKGN